jgi:hypothetical protein
VTDPGADAQFLEWLAERLPAHDTQTKERLRECAQHMREMQKAALECANYHYVMKPLVLDDVP